jgi:hypothetical protein
MECCVISAIIYPSVKRRKTGEEEANGRGSENCKREEEIKRRRDKI